MREIKFRGKRVDNGEWIYGYYGFKEESNKHFIMVETINLNSTSYFTDYEVHPESVGQYTGLKDKNGVEVYDGDVFQAPHDFGPGGFDVRQAVVRWHKIKGYQWEYWLLDQLEVIGNIYEHPHLLK